MSPFQKGRALYVPRFPEALKNLTTINAQITSPEDPDISADYKRQLSTIFKHTYGQPVLKIINEHKSQLTKDVLTALKVGVVLSGGQAPGGHNVICGIYEALKQYSQHSELIGFRCGLAGILNDATITITEEMVKSYINTGGFDMLGSGRTKIESEEDFVTCKKVLEKHQIHALIIVGGDDSNTNAALLAEYLKAQNSPITIIGVPKTIDGDLKNKYVETSFGFDTAVRLYAELIGNIAKDALSSQKYYHFIRLMGRSASHITLEGALQTHPNIVLISEEVTYHKKTLHDIVKDIADVIIKRAELGKNYGMVLVPEGIIEFVPEMKALIGELNTILEQHQDYIATLKGFTEQSEYINHKLSKDASYSFSSLPIDIQRQLLMDRDPHGNVQLSRVETEKLLIELLEEYLGEKKAEGKYHGKFVAQRHFLGYEGRCAAPTNFDADYAYALGRNTVALILMKANGYMSVIRNLAKPRQDWQPLGVPLTSMMTLETRKGKLKPVIKKSLVSLNGKPYMQFMSERESWAMEDRYRFAGAIQYFGPPELCDQVPETLMIELDL